MNAFYRITDSNGGYHYEYRRELAYEYYERNNCIKVESYNDRYRYSDIETIIDRAGVDIRLVRKDEDVLNKTKISMRNAIDKYDKNNTTQVKLKLNNNTDRDIIEFLNTCQNKQGLIKKLLREEMSRN